jgi:hypothetical protein
VTILYTFDRILLHMLILSMTILNDTYMIGKVNTSVADPDFYPSRIPELGSRIQKQQQKRGVKKICCHTFLCSHKFHKIENYFSFEELKKKVWPNFQRIRNLFTQKIVTKLSKIWVWDPGSGKNLFRIQDPGVKKASDLGSGSATLVNILDRFLISYKECCGSGSVSGLDPDSMGSLDPYPYPDSKSGSVSGFIIRVRIRIHLKCWIRIRIRIRIN